MKNPHNESINWISTEKELPNEDGYYWCSNHPDNPFDFGSCFYDGFGFCFQGIYRNVGYWAEMKSCEKRYGKL